MVVLKFELRELSSARCLLRASTLEPYERIIFESRLVLTTLCLILLDRPDSADRSSPSGADQLWKQGLSLSSRRHQQVRQYFYSTHTVVVEADGVKVRLNFWTTSS